ncbi:MAG: hypothetical protein AAF125_25395, partial [Chloroflexota bacterium]
MPSHKISLRDWLKWTFAASVIPWVPRVTRAQVYALHCPILMYHRVEVPPADADTSRLRLTVTPTDFADQLDALDAEGYRTLWQLAFAVGLPRLQVQRADIQRSRFD